MDYINDKFTDLRRLINNGIYGDWNIYRTEDKIKKSICNFTTFLSLSFESSSELPSYTIQSGSFRNYNKINNPNSIKISLAVDGNKNKLKNTIDTLEYYNSSIDLIDIETPYKVFIGYNLYNLSYSITSISMLIVEFDTKEIKQSSILFKTVANTNYSPTVKTGKQQLQEGKNNSSILYDRFRG